MTHLSSYLILATTSLVFAATAFALPVLGGGGDDGDSPPGGGGSGGGNNQTALLVPWDYPTIQAAIDDAGDGDHILVSPGTYVGGSLPWEPVIDTKGKALWIQADGDIFDPAPVIDGQNIRSCVVCSSGEGNDTIIQGFRIINGYATMGGGVYCFQGSPTFKDCGFEDNIAITWGGGFYSEGGSPKLVNCRFEGNVSGGFGGGMYNYDIGSLTLTDCTFMNNSAHICGGGMFNSGGNTTLGNCTFKGNTAVGYGGGMYNDVSCTPTLTGTSLCANKPDSISGSYADNGGNCISLVCQDTDLDGRPDCGACQIDDHLTVPGEYATIELAVDAAMEGATIEVGPGTWTPEVILDPLGKALTLRGTTDTEGAILTQINGVLSGRILQCWSGEGADTVFENLEITGGSAYVGGGMFNRYSSPTLTNCSFRDNDADLFGGGMYNDRDSNPILNNCTFRVNTSSYGGGMFNDHNSNPVLNSCTFKNNSAYEGGGMFNFLSSPSLFDCTITDNFADVKGGGMYNESEANPTLADTTVCGNTPDQIDGAWSDNGGNLVSDDCEFPAEGGNSPDINGDDLVNGEDMAYLLGAWGTDDLDSDLDGDGLVGGADLSILLGAWN